MKRKFLTSIALVTGSVVLLAGSAYAKKGSDEHYDFGLVNNSTLEEQDNLIVEVTIKEKKTGYNKIIASMNALNINLHTNSGAKTYTNALELSNVDKKPYKVSVEVDGYFANYTVDNPESGFYCICNPADESAENLCLAGGLIDPAENPEDYQAFCGSPSAGLDQVTNKRKAKKKKRR